MARALAAVIICAAATVGCGANPNAPTTSRVARLSRTRFMAFGDSLTSGEITNPMASSDAIGKLVVVPAASYPSVLQSHLQASYPSQSASISVANEGKGGETVFGGTLRFPEAFANARPEVVLLQEGVNGVAVDGAAVTTTLMRQMVQRAKDGGARVFVGSMIPTLPNRQRSQNQAALEAYNVALQAMCAQEGVTFVDLYNGMMPQAEQLIGIDGLHPTEVGYRKIADLFFAAIRAQLEQ